MATQPCAGCGRRLKIRPGRQQTECNPCAALTRKIKNRAACAARYKRVHGQGPAPAAFASADAIAAIFSAAAIVPAQSAATRYFRADYSDV